MPQGHLAWHFIYFIYSATPENMMFASRFPPEEFLSSLRGQSQGFLRDCYQAQGQSRQLLIAISNPSLCPSPDIGHLCFTNGEVSHAASTERIPLRRGTSKLLEFCIIIILAARIGSSKVTAHTH